MNQSAPDDVSSNYGVHQIYETLNLSFLHVTIKVKRISGSAFLYARQDPKGGTVEKIVPVASDHLKIEVAPIRPLNHPDRRGDCVFLKFDKSIHLDKGSAMTVFVKCPIEIGVFLVNGTTDRSSLDWFTCDPLNSRFALYGPADTGILCKYSDVAVETAESFDDTAYLQAVVRITVENKLDSGNSVSKVVFAITDNSIYYDGSKSILDGIDVTMKKRGLVDIADVKVKPIETDWTKSPTWESSTTNTIMEMGLE